MGSTGKGRGWGFSLSGEASGTGLDYTRVTIEFGAGARRGQEGHAPTTGSFVGRPTSRKLTRNCPISDPPCQGSHPSGSSSHPLTSKYKGIVISASCETSLMGHFSSIAPWGWPRLRPGPHLRSTSPYTRSCVLPSAGVDPGHSLMNILPSEPQAQSLIPNCD